MKLNQILPVVLGFAVLTIGGSVVSFAHSSPAVQNALINKDFNAFKSAIVKDAQTRADTLTQATFDDMSTRAINQKAVQDAIKANDYEAFKKVADTRMLAKVSTQELFTAMVNEQKAKDAILVKLDNAVKANDFQAFKAAQTEMMAQKDANHPENSNSTRPTPTDAQLQTHFNQLVANFKTDGSLPSTNGGGKGGFDRGFGGGHEGGHKGGKNRF